MTIAEILRRAHEMSDGDVHITITGDTATVGVCDRKTYVLTGFRTDRAEAETLLQGLARHCDEGWTMPSRHGRISDPRKLGLPDEVAYIRYLTAPFEGGDGKPGEDDTCIRMICHQTDAPMQGTKR